MDTRKINSLNEALLLIEKAEKTMQKCIGFHLLRDSRIESTEDAETILEWEVKKLCQRDQLEEDVYVMRKLNQTFQVHENANMFSTEKKINLLKTEIFPMPFIQSEIETAMDRFRQEFLFNKLIEREEITADISQIIDHANEKLIEGGFDKEFLKTLTL